MEAYETGTILGQGTYGVVYKGRCKVTGTEVAIKKTRYQGDKEGIPSNTLREISVLKGLSHPNVIKMLDVVCAEKHIYMIFECLNKDLKQHMKENVNGLEEYQTRTFIFQLFKAVSYCHSNRIIHRDIKPQNILLSSDGILKLADFGLARTYHIPVQSYTQEVITLWYRPPELIMNSYVYSVSVDMWSIGCIFSEMITGSPLFPGVSDIDQLFKIFMIMGTPDEKVWPGIQDFKFYKKDFPKMKKKNLEDLHPNSGVLVMQLLKSLLEYVPCKRITAREGLNHAYFNVFKVQR